MRQVAMFAAGGLCLTMVLTLWHCIFQGLHASRDLSQQVEALGFEVERLYLTPDRWQKIYQLSRAARDYPSFAAHLESADLLSPADALLSANAPATESARLSEAVQSPVGAPQMNTGNFHTADPPAASADGTTAQRRNRDAAGSVAGSDGTRLATTTATTKPLHPELNREWAWQHSRENLVIVTFSNFHFVDFVENWALHLAHHHIANYLVGAMDRDTAKRLRELHIAYFAMFDQDRDNSGLGQDDFGWGSSKFHQMGRQKISLLQSFLSFGLDIVLCDTDTVWMNDPTDYFNRFPLADILTSSDHMSPTIPIGDDGLEEPEAMHSAMNIGVMLFRHSNSTRDFVRDWVQTLAADKKVWDQNAFNSLARHRASSQEGEDHDRLFRGHDGKLWMGVLPVASFASGHTYHVQHLAQIMEVKPYVVHQTFQFGGSTGKRHRLREAMLWYDEPEYYSGQQFIHAELNYLPEPPNFEDLPDFNMSLFHLQNIEHQLKQVRQLFSVALLTDRVVVMPKLLCYCDRYWGPLERCRLPGARRLVLPFVCPLDHIFEPFHFDDKPEQFGPAFQYREHSFFENARTPTEVKNDVLTLKLDEVAPAQTVQVEDSYHLRVGPGTTLSNLWTSLASVNATVLRLEFVLLRSSSDMTFALEPFDDQELQTRFEHRLEHMPGFWCCRREDGPLGKGGTPYSNMLVGKGIEHRQG